MKLSELFPEQQRCPECQRVVGPHWSPKEPSGEFDVLNDNEPVFKGKSETERSPLDRPGKCRISLQQHRPNAERRPR